MADITLADILRWEPRLRPLGGVAPAEWDEREITWSVTARTSSPMLPSIRGGELVLLPSRVIADSGLTLPLLLRELSGHGAGAAVIDQPLTERSPMPVLVAEAIPPDFESDLNRLLTERRGELYRAGTDLGRLLMNGASTGADLPAILALASDFLDTPVTVRDQQGSVIAGAGNERDRDRTLVGDALRTRLAGGETLAIGPAPDARRALVRLAAERIALAAEAAIQRAASARPRGPARAAALTALLTGGSPDVGRAAALLGLPAHGAYRVALASPDLDAPAMHRTLAGLGALHDANAIDGRATLLIELRSDAANASRHRQANGRPQLFVPHGWIALSGVAAGLGSAAEAANEARFVAGLLAAGRLPAGVARFDALADIGAYRLLRHLWGTTEIESFARDALGELATRDRRGTLRATLLAFLECGGSHVEAAKRLGIHRNTLAYRLRQIADLTDRDPDDPSTWLVFHLGLLAASLPPMPTLAHRTD
jgi:purine catabolism regulator